MKTIKSKLLKALSVSMILMSCSKTVTEPNTSSASLEDNNASSVAGSSAKVATCQHIYPTNIVVGSDCYGQNHPGSGTYFVNQRYNSIKWNVNNYCGINNNNYNFENGPVYYSIYKKTSSTNGSIGTTPSSIDVYTREIVFSTTINNMYYAGMLNTTKYIINMHEKPLTSYPTTIYQVTSGVHINKIYQTIGSNASIYASGIDNVHTIYFTTTTNAGPNCNDTE